MAVNNGMLPGTSLMSFEQLCAENDPHFYSGRDHPWFYSFSNGRKFGQPLALVAVITDPVPLINALTFNGKAFMFGNEQVEFQRNYTGANAVDALAPPVDSTKVPYANAMGFADRPLNFGTDQLEFACNYMGFDAVDPYAPAPDSTQVPFADSLGFANRPLNFATQQLEFTRPKLPTEI